MATLKPFRILRPRADKAADICTLPYDVMNTEEARRMAEGKPLSFLRVTRSEIEFPEDADPYSDAVYRHGAENLRRMIAEGHLFQDPEPVYMLYKLVMGSHAQVGLVAAASCAEYDNGIIKKHELTRPDKEDDRMRHINILAAQTGAVFLTYKAETSIDAIVAEQTKRTPDIDFTAEDGIRHSAWVVKDAATIGRIEGAFAKVPALYVADGHHRSAAASRVAKERKAANSAHNGTEPYNFFLTVTFPHNQMQIMPYNRAVKDLNGLTEAQVLERIAKIGDLSDAPTDHMPTRKGEATVYIGGKWRLLRFKQAVVDSQPDTVAKLDVSVLQDHVLSPILGIGDPRIDKRISFVGGIRGTGELEKLVNSGKYAIAFAMYPTSINDLMTIADEDGLMPPKSTWFEPKLRDAMAVHLI